MHTSMFICNVLTLICTTAWLRAHDALSMAVQDNLVIMTPNMDFILEFHHFKDKDLQVRMDSHFGIINCFQWPQGYDQIFPYAACIPRKESFPFPHPLHWAWFTPNQDDFIPVPGNSFPVGTLAQDKVQGLQSLLKLAQGRCGILVRVRACINPRGFSKST